tara:strand:+ start:304 stop:528 length:225 start_codon:yes stop_codon:yes gene_type:complete
MKGIGIEPKANPNLLTNLLLPKFIFFLIENLFEMIDIILNISSKKRMEITIDFEINRMKINVKLYEKNLLKFPS